MAVTTVATTITTTMVISSTKNGRCKRGMFTRYDFDIHIMKRMGMGL